MYTLRQNKKLASKNWANFGKSSAFFQQSLSVLVESDSLSMRVLNVKIKCEPNEDGNNPKIQMFSLFFYTTQSGKSYKLVKSLMTCVVIHRLIAFNTTIKHSNSYIHCRQQKNWIWTCNAQTILWAKFFIANKFLQSFHFQFLLEINSYHFKASKREFHFDKFKFVALNNVSIGEKNDGLSSCSCADFELSNRGNKFHYLCAANNRFCGFNRIFDIGASSEWRGFGKPIQVARRQIPNCGK